MIYLVQMDELPFFKIGYARSVPDRVRALQASSPLPLQLRYCGPGDCRREAELHDALVTWRTRGEWFAITERSTECVLSLFGLRLRSAANIDERVFAEVSRREKDESHARVGALEARVRGLETALDISESEMALVRAELARHDILIPSQSTRRRRSRMTAEQRHAILVETARRARAAKTTAKPDN